MSNENFLRFSNLFNDSEIKTVDFSLSLLLYEKKMLNFLKKKNSLIKIQSNNFQIFQIRQAIHDIFSSTISNFIAKKFILIKKNLK